MFPFLLWLYLLKSESLPYKQKKKKERDNLLCISKHCNVSWLPLVVENRSKHFWSVTFQPGSFHTISDLMISRLRSGCPCPVPNGYKMRIQGTLTCRILTYRMQGTLTYSVIPKVPIPRTENKTSTAMQMQKGNLLLAQARAQVTSSAVEWSKGPSPELRQYL